jgi:hypothetical protein
MIHNNLTNEALKKPFKSPFHLALSAIKSAQAVINSGNEIPNIDQFLSDHVKNISLNEIS